MGGQRQTSITAAQNRMLVTASDDAVRYGEFESCASLPRWSRARSPCRPASSPLRRWQAWVLRTAHDLRAVRTGDGEQTVAGRPNYIAFRIPEGRGLLTVVAAVQPGARAAFSWALWYSTLAPTGELKKAPVNFIRFRIGARIAKPLIEVIKSGGSLPADLVEQLPIIKL